jgi:uncharacterized protein YbcC (UPF0753/DUF2309 family)
MTTYTTRYEGIDAKVERACLRIAPLWPLKHFVAVNPYFGLRDKPFWEADRILRKGFGVGLTMPRTYYEERIATGRIAREDLEDALKEMGSRWDVSELKRAMKESSSARTRMFPLFSDVVSANSNRDWSKVIVDRVSHYSAAYFDEGQAVWTMPWRAESFYRGWLSFMSFDKSLRIFGLKEIRTLVGSLPTAATDAIAWALSELAVPADVVEDYLFYSLLSIGGWAAWARYLRWQAELRDGTDEALRDLLAVRVCWDLILLRAFPNPGLLEKWHQMLRSAKDDEAGGTNEYIDSVLQRALEIGYERSLVKSLNSSLPSQKEDERPAAQAAFCIDVRSEIIRRALETVAPKVQTLGFAGFFGVLMEYVPFGADVPKGHLPVLFKPRYQVWEGLIDADETETRRQINKRLLRLRASHAWKVFKTSAVSTFTFVESMGLIYIPKLFGDSLGLTRTVPHPHKKGLNKDVKHKLRPQLTAVGSQMVGDKSHSVGIPEEDLASVGGFILNNMGLKQTFARIVLLVGHGSTTVNNPQGTGLDCGACAGQTGEASARIAAALLNDPITRRGLEEKGIKIPEDTYFIAGLHDTTTDEVTLFDTEELPDTHAEDLKQLRKWLADAGELTRLERANFLGTGSRSPAEVLNDMRRRTRDWAEVRPEWGLAGNSAFIAAPRERTRNIDLAGRVFLHDYNWRADAGFATLELIMTAPMVVANWINMQYYGSMVDNLHFGSGNKVLHNVVGGSIGVLEGNGGDLRVGLAMQSLHDGKDWIHEPIRLNVLIEAPQEQMDEIISRNDVLRELVENSWVHLFQIDDCGKVHRRLCRGEWQLVV